MIDTQNTKFRIKAASLIWLILFIVMSMSILFLAISLIFYYIGGLSLVLDVWSDKARGDYLWIGLTPIPPSFHFGSKLGTKLWKILMHKTGFISDQQAREMIG